MDVTVTAKKAFPYKGQDVKPGDLVRMDRTDAAFYERYGFVLSQTYQTRDLTAQ